MADKFVKKAIAEPPVENWKNVVVEKEHQPAKIKSEVTYAGLEMQVANIDSQIADLAERKKALEAEMAKVKAAVEK
jgi:predicted  nucleic acid-binding Zn-ribbon protein